MAPKTMEPVARKVFKGVLFLEVLGVFAAYGLYYRMNTSRDFRCTMNKRFPSILEVYYKSNEWAGNFESGKLIRTYGLLGRNRQTY